MKFFSFSSSLAAPKSNEGGSSSSIWRTHISSPSMFDVRCSMFDVRQALAFICSLFTLSSAFGQGALTPPGPPAATMLTLTQVEPRTPISSLPLTIANPGSYYLTTNLVCTASNGIFITASDVTLDLNGFTISSTVPDAANGGMAIMLNGGLSDITIYNGHIVSGVTNNGSNVYSGSGFAYGIGYTGTSPLNVRVSHVSVSGILFYGITLYNSAGSTLVESCTARTIGTDGIVADTVKQSSAIDCGATAIQGDQVFDSRGQSTGLGDGIYASDDARDCYGTSSGNQAGISAATSEDCYGYSGGYYGITGTTALNCFGYSNSGNGIVVENAENCYGNCNTGGYGIYAYYIANGCYGFSNTGTGLYAFLANVCHGATGTGTPLITSHNVNSY